LYNPKAKSTGGGPKRTGGKPPAAPVVQNPKPISPARQAAFAILERVEMGTAHSDDLLHGPGMSPLSQADRNLATTLVLGVLRWQIALDARMVPLLARPDMEVSTPVAVALRLGAFQLLHLDRIPAHAALSESVELVRAAGHGHASGMVNAILRKLQRQVPVKAKLYEATEAFADRLGHPGWMVERWVKNYGRSAAMAVCEYDQQPPALGGLFGDEAEGEGMPRMDDGSRLAAELAAKSVAAPKRIWDCCAAPGGKTLMLAKRHPQAEIVASDVSSKRVKALAERLKDLTAVRVLEADATRLGEGEGEFDLILCDVPCSGTGTLGRNPEIKLRLEPAELSRQAKRQREILTAALGRLSEGGRLVYSTCSLEPEENERVVEAVLGELPGFERLAVGPVLESVVPSSAALVREGYLRTLPGVGFQGDGFFAALFARR
jgi:16S rRNA (cytosine967-C5)-methyltransferase